MKKILYLGDGPKNGPACYLLAILKHAKFLVTHIEPSKTLPTSLMRGHYDLIILSDYSRQKLSPVAMKWIGWEVMRGSAFLMIGGWGSFNGLNKGYKGSLIEKILPVTCLNRDDRRNLGSGATITKAASHPVLKNIPLKPSPVLIGYNEVIAKKNARVVLNVRENVGGKKNPLLVIGHYGLGKSAAFTTDLAPHWCGGLVDWGNKRVKLSVDSKIGVEVGNLYVQFFSNFFKWLAS